MKKRPTKHRRSPAASVQALLGQAVDAFQQQRPEAARQILETLLRIEPRHFDALHLLGVIAGSMNDAVYAVELFRRALAENPRDAVAYNNLAGALLHIGQFDQALESSERALEVRPQYAEAFYRRGKALKALGQLEAAVESYDRVIALRPDFADAYKDRGDALADLERCDEAVGSYDRALELDPQYAEALYNRGITLMDSERYAAAVESFDRAIALEPEYVEAHASRGSALLALEQFAAAVESFDQAITIGPATAALYCNRGVALLDLAQEHAALADFDQALAMDPLTPEVHRNRGVALQQLGRNGEAVASLARAIELDPEFAEAYSSLGVALKDLGEIDAALANFDKAIELQPDYAPAHWNKSLALLTAGELQEGWKLYEWRWRSERVRRTITAQSLRVAPDWNGESLAGSIVVLPEQGIGDQIFYSGMLRDLQSRARRITACLDARLLPLYRRSFDGIDFRTEAELEQSGDFDFQVRLPSLGRFFRSKPDDFAGVRVPFLFADRARATAMRARIASDRALLCGLSWLSRSSRFAADKSLSLDQLRPVLSQSTVRFIDLQYGDTRAEQAMLAENHRIRLEQIPEIDNLSDIDALAALIEACDVVLTVSNTTAHLAAALGKPVLIMLPHGAGLLWYWHLGRSDSPWYPTAKLFRQDRTGSWDSVFRAVIDHLSAFAAGRY